MIEAKSGEEFTVGWKSRKRDRRRILLRPHGSGGRVSKISFGRKDGGRSIWRDVGSYQHPIGKRQLLTRAQAAQAVYEGGRSAE